MKFIFASIMLFGCFGYSQSQHDFVKQIKEPDIKDSLLIYNNAIQINKFFENNKLYTKTASHEINDKSEIFNALENARIVFFKIRNSGSVENLNDPDYIKVNPHYNDITYQQYYKKVDEYKFFQRELENQIINANSPMSLYDNRICPFIVNEYKCEDKSSIYYGDIVNIPMYIPIIVKPFRMLTEEEKNARAVILKKNYQSTIESVSKNEIPNEINENKYRKGNAVFYFNSAGSGSIIGFMNCGVFRKLRKEEYKEFVVMKYAQDFLENEEEFKNWLKLQFGGYCLFVR